MVFAEQTQKASPERRNNGNVALSVLQGRVYSCLGALPSFPTHATFLINGRLLVIGTAFKNASALMGPGRADARARRSWARRTWYWQQWHAARTRGKATIQDAAARREERPWERRQWRQRSCRLALRRRSIGRRGGGWRRACGALAPWPSFRAKSGRRGPWLTTRKPCSRHRRTTASQPAPIHDTSM